MTLSSGASFGPYVIVSPLGAGGMGEVYRARDSRLNREVALKILPDLFAFDADRLARFQREAQTLAAINHPNIATIHGFEEIDGVRVIVLEVVEGPTLADRIATGPIPLEEALPIARQIAEALEAAHSQGIIHRDLKPANIKVRDDGTVKVLDFGLAKVLEPATGSGDSEHSPTITSPAVTQAGVLLGTAAYMAPEQARGRTVGTRGDLWAFGCVLFEMLTGRRAFPGHDVTDTLAAVIKTEPDFRQLPPDTPTSIRRLLRRCLAKDPKERIADASMARIEIDEARKETDGDRLAAEPGRRRVGVLTAVVGGSAIAIAAAALTALLFRPTALPETRLEIASPPTTDYVSFAVSPDGRLVAFVASAEGRARLWLRRLDAESASPLQGTDFASLPFWSPDSRSIGFFADAKLKRIDLEGGTVQPLATANAGKGGTWNRDGTILFAPGISGHIVRVAATGGETVPVTRAGSPLGAHRFPQFLPDGRHFIYYVAGSPDVSGVYVGVIDGTETHRLVAANAAAEYLASGYLLTLRQGSLLAQRFDADGMKLTGEAMPVAEDVPADWYGKPAVSTSATGLILHRTGSPRVERQYVWVDRAGRVVESVGEPDGAIEWSPSLSPDGRTVAAHRLVEGNMDIWLLELARGVRRRFTFDAANEVYPVWSPDGRRIAFSSLRGNAYDVYVKDVGGSAEEQLLVASDETKIVTDWSPDGRFIVFRGNDPKTGRDLWAVRAEPGQKPFPVVRTEFNESHGSFSPDSKWLAYESNKSGRAEVYVQPFPGPGTDAQISTNGGAQVRWGRDQKEIFYVALDGRLMAVPIHVSADGRSIEPGVPVPLFPTHIGGAIQEATGPLYMVSPDGSRFLMDTITQEITASPISVILNWKPRGG